MFALGAELRGKHGGDEPKRTQLFLSSMIVVVFTSGLQSPPVGRVYEDTLKSARQEVCAS